MSNKMKKTEKMSKNHIADGGIEPGGGWEKFFKKMEFFKKLFLKKPDPDPWDPDPEDPDPF